MAWIAPVASVAGSVVSGLLSKSAAGQASKEAQKAAAMASWASALPKIGLQTPFGSLTPKLKYEGGKYGSFRGYRGGSRIGLALSPEYQAIKDQYGNVAQGIFSNISGFNPNTYTQEYLDTLRQYAAPEELRRQEALESRLFGRGMLGSVSGARQIEDFQRMLQQEDLQRILASKDRGIDEYGKLLGLFGTATGGMQDIDSQLMGLFGQYNQLAGNTVNAQQSSADRIYQAALAGIAGQMQGRIGMAQGLGNLIGGLGGTVGSLFSSSNTPSTVNIPGMGLGTYNTSGYDITQSPIFRGLY